LLLLLLLFKLLRGCRRSSFGNDDTPTVGESCLRRVSVSATVVRLSATVVRLSATTDRRGCLGTDESTLTVAITCRLLLLLLPLQRRPVTPVGMRLLCNLINVYTKPCKRLLNVHTASNKIADGSPGVTVTEFNVQLPPVKSIRSIIAYFCTKSRKPRVICATALADSLLLCIEFSAVCAYATSMTSVHPSVRLSVCPSLTLVGCDHTVQQKVQIVT